MKLYGHVLPLDDGGYIVTVVCPNDGTRDRLLVELARIESEDFAPAIATSDGFPATGGGGSSQTMLDAGEFDRELTPAQAALIELGDEDAPIAGLKAGEATNV